MKRPYSVQLELMSMVMSMLYEQMKEQFDFAEVDKILNRLEELTVELETVAGMFATLERIQREGQTRWREETEQEKAKSREQ